MAAFDYAHSPVPIRADLPAAHRRAWERLAGPGSWWAGPERVAIAAEVRRARDCALCAARKEALSPESVAGDHDGAAALPGPAVDAIHRIVTDPGRLSQGWFDRTIGESLSVEQYVELLGLLVSVVCIDGFHRAMGLPLEPLPEPRAGEPDRYRPSQARLEKAYVPMIPARGATGAEADLWSPTRSANVIRAMSLVPEAVRQLKELSQAQYLPMEQVADPTRNGGRSLDRAQIELVAGRVSALSECFY